MSRRVVALGTRDLTAKEYAVVSARAKSGLKTLMPTVVYTDLAPGWNLTVGKESVNLSYTVTGVFPYGEVIGSAVYRSQRMLVYNRMATKLVFEPTYLDYLKNPRPYLEWLVANVDHVLAYVDHDRPTRTLQLVSTLRKAGVDVLNLMEVS